MRQLSPPIDTLLDEVRSTDWDSWAIRPAGRLWAYDAASVIPAFDRIPAVHDEKSSWLTYSLLLDAFAHNYSGTPCPAMVPAVGILVGMVPLVDGRPLRTLFEVLCDCLYWSHGEPEFIGPDGQRS